MILNMEQARALLMLAVGAMEETMKDSMNKRMKDSKKDAPVDTTKDAVIVDMDKNPMNQALFEKAANLYRENGSLQKTADVLGVAYAKVRKILITVGAYETPMSRSINYMRQAGKEPADIAEVLGMSLKRVNAFLPYEKGIYGDEVHSVDAKRSRLYRKRMDIARSRLVSNMKEDQVSMETRENQRAQSHVKSASNTTAHTHKDEASKGIYPVHLHLELKGEWLDDDQKRKLWRYADATKEGVLTRDILIPSDMPLHHLHYAIQRLYGWQNSHLRAFRLDEVDHQRLGGDMFQSWSALAGILYQGLDVEGAFWDDEYQRGSVRNWLKSKYVGPYRFDGLHEEYEGIQREIGVFVRRFPALDIKREDEVWLEQTQSRLSDKGASETIRKKVPIMDLAIREVEQSITFDKGFDELLEKLEVTSVLAGKDTPLADKDALIEHFHGEGKRRLAGVGGGSGVMRALPVTTKLFYNYDYGDNWVIELTRGDLEGSCEATGVTETALRKACQTVVSEHRPVCIAKRGAQLMDDVGGMHGYATFMEVVKRHSPHPEREEYLEWAKGLGWTGRDVSLGRLL